MRFHYLSILLLTTLIFFNSCSKEDENEDRSLKASSFRPLKVDLGDTISIRGENFGRNTKVFIDATRLPLIFNNDTLIKFRLPYEGFDPLSFKIKLNNELSEGLVYENPIELYEPVIDSVTNNSGFGERAVIYGKHLTNSPGKTKDILYVNNKMIEVESQSKDSLVFYLNSILTYSNDILIKAQLQEVKLENGLKVASPVIEGVVEKKIKVGEPLTIYGQQFLNNDTENNLVFIDGVKAIVLEARRDKLVVKMPIGPYADRDIDEIKLKVFTEEVNFHPDLKLDEVWYLTDVIKKSEITNSPYSGNLTRSSFMEGGQYYINSFWKNASGNSMNTKMFRYDPIEQEVTDLPDIPLSFENYSGHILQIYPLYNEQDVFIYLGRENDNFFIYNYLSGEIKKLQDFPGKNIKEATGVMLENDFYLGLGHTGLTSVTANMSFWKYDIQNNNWSLDSNASYESDRAANSRKTEFVWDNSLYTGNGSDWQYDFWKFNPDEGWTKKASTPNPISSFIYFQIGDLGYYYHQYDNEFWEYSKTSDQWTNRKDLSIGSYRFSAESSFVTGGNIYLVGYHILHYYHDEYGLEGATARNDDQLILKTEISNL